MRKCITHQSKPPTASHLSKLASWVHVFLYQFLRPFLPDNPTLRASNLKLVHAGTQWLPVGISVVELFTHQLEVQKRPHYACHRIFQNEHPTIRQWSGFRMATTSTRYVYPPIEVGPNSSRRGTRDKVGLSSSTTSRAEFSRATYHLRSINTRHTLIDLQSLYNRRRCFI